MKIRIFTYVACRCGHRGALIESLDVGDLPDRRYRTWVRSLTHAGTYKGGNGLFAAMTPGCPACGQSLDPNDVVGHRTLEGADGVLRLKHDSESAETTHSAGL